MSHYLIDIHYGTHTCPAGATPHVVDEQHTIVDYRPGGPCENPQTVHCGTATVTLDCGRVLRSDRQCAACRTVITVRTKTHVHVSPHVPPPVPAPVGMAAQPCRVCGDPLAAVLAERGTHLLCAPPRDGRR